MPEAPSEELLQSKANRLNEILRECKIKDEYRPVYATAFMLAVWQGDPDTAPDKVLGQVNAYAARALSGSTSERAMPPRRIPPLAVDTDNAALAARAGEIIDLFRALHIRPGFSGHDYLGRLYETFFRYTGGNTIGQYFTPRHIIEFICALIPIGPGDSVFDPACGTGGFLIGAWNKGAREENLFGIESESSTAALCAANMVLRGGSGNGILRGNCFTEGSFPASPVDYVLMNPPFPHKRTDTGPIEFIDRGLQSLRTGGILVGVFPYSLLVRTTNWHRSLLASHTLLLVATLPPDLFSPYASYNTAIVMIRKGVPHAGEKTFVCRIPNDGFKLKKKTRLPREGSLLATLLEAFARESDIPALCTTARITEDSPEWSPEAFLEGAAYSPEEFTQGLEAHIRKQASFYVLHGARLLPGEVPEPAHRSSTSDLYAPTSLISMADIPLGYMTIADYLAVNLGGNDEIEDLEEGPIPVVSTSEFFNGVTAWKTTSIIYPSPCITVATDGSVASTFVQEAPFYAFYKVALLSPIKPVDPDALYYIAYMISRERWRYVYARKFGKNRILQTQLLVPVRPDGTPDFDRMGEIVRGTRAFPLIQMFRERLTLGSDQ